ncbi:MAG: insulinase family protein, partial [Alicyclobacillus sp.]|nr:insulinase family protein [Alicyclobacillus sp.]
GTHPLGYTILGLEENLLAFSRDDLERYVGARYTPHNLVIAVVGNIPQAQAVAAVEKWFSQPFPGIPGDPSPSVSPPVFHHTVNVRNKETEQVHVCLAVPGLAAGDPRQYALVLLNNALGNAPSSRLFQEIREERGLAYSVFSFHTAYRDCGMFGIYTGTSPDTVEDVLRLIVEICEDMATRGLSEEELRKGKEQVKGSMMLSLESTSSRMSRLGKNELLLGREVSLDETLAEISRVRPEDIRDVAQTLLRQPFAVAAVGPVAETSLLRALGRFH